MLSRFIEFSFVRLSNILFSHIVFTFVSYHITPYFLDPLIWWWKLSLFPSISIPCNATINMGVHIFLRDSSLFPLDIGKRRDCWIIWQFYFQFPWEASVLLFIVTVPTYILTNSTRVSFFSILTSIAIFCLSRIAIITDARWFHIVILVCIFLVINDVGYLSIYEWPFVCLLGVYAQILCI